MIEVMIILLNIIQLKSKDKIPKVIIDQGWHQKGFKSQNFILECEFIKERYEIIKSKQY